MKSKTQTFELTAAQEWIANLRARMAARKGQVARPGQPTVTTFMCRPRATL